MPSSTDRVTVAVAEGSLVLPFRGLTYRSDFGAPKPGIQVGDTFYPT